MMLLLAMAVIGPVEPRPGDPCGTPDPGAITVCRRLAPGAAECYRLPLRADGFDPRGPVDSVSRERHRLMDGDGGAPDMTRGSCSAVGQDGFTGCMIKGWRERDQQHGH